MNKPILDATCGGRMMWFDKRNPLVLFVDNRKLPPTDLCDGRLFEVKPDMLADFTDLPFPDRHFKLVVFDPPHLIRVSDLAYMKIKFERLPEDWPEMLRKGFNECMRVLDDWGTLIFKWSEVQIPTSKVIAAIGKQPLFGHISGKKSNTHWMTYIKVPDKQDQSTPWADHDPAQDAVDSYEDAWDYPAPEQQKRYSGLLEDE